jgi:hypothetical protein
MAGLKLREKVTRFLKERPEEKFTARAIASWIFENYPDECRAKRDKSDYVKDDEQLLNQIVAEIGANRPAIQKRTPQIKTTEERPRKYYFTSKSDVEEVQAIEQAGLATAGAETSPKQNAPAGNNTPSDNNKLSEHDLYPMLSQYLWAEFGIYSRRIDEKRSANRRGPNGNKWLYPDVVGMEDLSAEWDPEVKSCVNQYSDKQTKLWSFEVKLLLNRSNVRECFFQAVSNSSWSNYGYLVAGEVEGGETLKELRMLSAAHGIGLVRLDTENPAESQVLVPARERIEIDWDTTNRLATENKDFLDYIKLVRQFYQTGDPRPSDWDLPENELD